MNERLEEANRLSLGVGANRVHLSCREGEMPNESDRSDRAIKREGEKEREKRTCADKKSDNNAKIHLSRVIQERAVVSTRVPSVNANRKQ
jgi:hypothetical protein